MAYIKVDHQKMIAAAEQIESYVAQFDRDMKQADSAVVALSASWKGQDYQQLRAEWEEMKAPDSTSAKMRSALNGYAGALREAAKKYKEAQTKAINRANSLCK